MINTNLRTPGLGTNRSGFSTGQGDSSISDTFTRSGGSRGVFFNTPAAVKAAEVAPKDPTQPSRASADKLQSGLGLSSDQAQKLADAANVDFQEPYKAGRLDTGEVFLVTAQNYQLDPKGFKSYEDYFKVYVMDGQTSECKELEVTSARRMRDGGSTYIGTQAGSFNFPVRGEASVCGRPLTARLDSLQMS